MASQIAIIGAMAIVTYATRAGGLALAERLPSSARVAAIFDTLANATLAALLAAIVVRGDLAMALGTFAAAVAMLLLKRPLVAMTLAAVIAAAVRAVPPLGL